MTKSAASKLPEIRFRPHLRDLPIHGVTLGRIGDIAAAAACAADRGHVQAGRLKPEGPRGIKR